MKKLLAIITVVNLVGLSLVGFFVYQIKNEFHAGATIPVVTALFTTSLANKITGSATSITLTSGTDKEGNALTGTVGFIISEGTSNEEFVTCSASGATLTSCSRGLSVVNPASASSALEKSHRRGASVKITNYQPLATLARIANGQESFPNLLYYDSNQDFTTASSSVITDKNYVDNVASAGAADASLTVKGLVEEATIAQVNASAGIRFGDDTTARLFVNPSVLASSNYFTYLPIKKQKDALAGSSGEPSSTNKYITQDDVSSVSFSDANDKVIRSDGDALPDIWVDIDQLSIAASASGDLIYHDGTNFNRLAYPTITNSEIKVLTASVSSGTPKWGTTKNYYASGQGKDLNATDLGLVAASVSFTPNWVQLHYSCNGANASPSGSAIFFRGAASTVAIGGEGEGNDTNLLECAISAGNGITFAISISTDGDSIYITATEAGTSANTAWYWFAGI